MIRRIAIAASLGAAVAAVRWSPLGRMLREQIATVVRTERPR